MISMTEMAPMKLMTPMTPVNKFVVNGQEISLEKFEEMRSNPKIRLVELSKGMYKMLQRLEG